MTPFEAIEPAGGVTVPLVVHVPHAGTWIPPEVRAGILLDDGALAREVARMTDWHTDRLFEGALELGGVLFVNRLSRLVVDPERFAEDADEPMAAVGMGAVYGRASDGALLRKLDARARRDLMDAYFHPYHSAAAALVDDILGRFGRCLIVDAHSFPLAPLAFELCPGPPRPDICLGTDPYHTPEGLAEALELQCARRGLSVARNHPFAGSYVPLTHLRSSRGVSSVMIEVRRDLYCEETTGAEAAGFAGVQESIRALLAAAVAAGALEGKEGARPSPREGRDDEHNKEQSRPERRAVRPDD